MLLSSALLSSSGGSNSISEASDSSSSSSSSASSPQNSPAAEEDHRPTVVDLFCGGGGSSLGFELAGFRICKAYDFDDSVLRVFNDNHKHVRATKLDLNDVDAAIRHILLGGEGDADLSPPWIPDVIIASPPCTDFSQAGGIVEGDAASLTVKCADIISGVRPSTFVIENVVRAATSVSFARAIHTLSNAGYIMRIARADACRVGVPQRRKRIFCIGVHMDGLPHARRALDRACSQIDAVSETEEETTIAAAFEKHGLTPIPSFLHYVPRNSFCPEFVPTNRPYPTLRCVNSMSAPKSPLTRPHRPSNPVCSLEDRPVKGLTLDQMCVISAFPRTYKFFSMSAAQKVMGNCVPPLLAAHVARALLHNVVHRHHHLDMETCAHPPPSPEAGLVNPERVRDPHHFEETERFIDTRFGDAQTRASIGASVVVRPGSKTGARELTYIVGTSAEGDAAAGRVVSHHLTPGWIVVVRERHVRRTRAQDVYVRIPGEDILYLSRRSLVKNGHLT